jgi:hypothetical protein
MKTKAIRKTEGYAYDCPRTVDLSVHLLDFEFHIERSQLTG